MNNETKHTPEPWHVGIKQAEQIVYDKTGWAVCNATVFHGHGDPDGEAKANARRIVACVNACAAISDNELTHGPVIALNKFSFVVNEREEARAQRDALAAELRETLADLKDWDGTQDAMDIIQQNIAAALANL